MHLEAGLGSSLAARSRPRRVQDAPRTRQDGARRRPGGDKNRLKIKFRCQEASETDLGPILGGFLVDFGAIWDRFLEDFGLNFGWVFDVFWKELG